MITILKVIAVTKGNVPLIILLPEDGVFPTVDEAREFYRNEFKTDKIILCYVSK